MVAHSLVIESELDPGAVVRKCFLVKFEKFLRIAFLQNTSCGCFCASYDMALKAPLLSVSIGLVIIKNDVGSGACILCHVFYVFLTYIKHKFNYN